VQCFLQFTGHCNAQLTPLHTEAFWCDEGGTATDGGTGTEIDEHGEIELQG